MAKPFSMFGFISFVEKAAIAHAARQLRVQTRVDLYIARLAKKKDLDMSARVKVAGTMLKDRVKVNLSRPVFKYRSLRTGRTVVYPQSRSKEGQFPRADTTRLMKDIFMRYSKSDNSARIGTTLDYGLILEVRMHRSFLRRTLNEMRPQLIAILLSGKGAGPGTVIGGTGQEEG